MIFRRFFDDFSRQKRSIFNILTVLESPGHNAFNDISHDMFTQKKPGGHLSGKPGGPWD